MATGRIQRQIDRLLDEAEQASVHRDWETVRDRVQHALTFDPENADAIAFLAAADRTLPDLESATGPVHVPAEKESDQPESFADGRYRVKEFLGEGGKKLVYLAHDATLDREVAFALIKTDGLDETSRARITREAQAMGRLGAHPHIVTVFDLGEHPSTGSGQAGQPYVVTELMGGGDVEGVIEDADGQHGLPLEQAIELAISTCRGLEFAHSKGIVHRDLKPGNVMLTSDGTAKIGDFGLAVATDRSRLTQEGMMVGTVSYMPPEQAIGGEVTPQADLYSLGAMLYEMVTGRPPFVGDDSVAIIGQHLNTPPVAPTWHNADLPPALEALVLRLLEKDPASRPESAASVIEALEAIDLGARLQTSVEDQPAGPDPAYRRTFVGREAEIGQLHAAFDEAVSGHGSLVMVVGEPGIGKTSLCEQLATYATLRGGSHLVGHCYEEGSLSLPYLAFVEAMRSYVLAREPDDLKSDLGSGASEVARIVSEVRDRLDVEPSEPGDPEEDRYRLMQAVTSFITNAGNVQPLAIVLEDLHDADRGTLDMLMHVARNLSGSRLLIVGTYRDVEVDRSHPLSGALAELRRVASFERIPLRGLTADEVQRMMSGISGQDVQWSLSETVHRQTEGNPLFVQEVLRYLVEQGYLGRDDRTRRQTPPEMGLPEGLRDVIGKRLSGLSEQCNSVLSIAAVMGREFSLQVLQRVAEVSEDDLFAALEEASGVGVVEERSSVGGDVSFRFAHAFFRQTLYEEIFTPRRIRMHQQVGQALEAVHTGRLEEHAAELAEHFSQSTERDDLQKALGYGERAAQRAMSVFAYGEAAEHLERCIQVQEVVDADDKANRCDLLLALGDALMPAGELTRTHQELGPEAFALAEAMGDRERTSRACQMALTALFRHSARAVEVGEEFGMWAERADRHATPESRERVWADLALAARTEGIEYGEHLVLVRRAVDVARQLNDPETLFLAAGRLLSGTFHDPQGQLALAEEFASHVRAGVSPRTLGALLRGCVSVYLAHGERRRAEELQREIDELASRTNDATLVLTSLAVDTHFAALDGPEDCVASAKRMLARSEELGLLGGPATYRVVAYRPLVYLGRVEEVFAAQRRYEDMVGADIEGGGRIGRLFGLAHLGRFDEAAEAYQQARERGIKREQMAVDTAVTVLEIALLHRDHETAATLLSRLRVFASLCTQHLSTCIGRHLGAAAALVGKPDEGRDFYRQALELAHKLRFRAEIALTRLQMAELLLDSYPDERAEALEHLDFAIGELRDMKMQPFLERALSRRELLEA